MAERGISGFFMPTKQKIALFAIFLFVAIVGQMQFDFVMSPERQTPPPSGAIQYIGFWVTWMYLSVPVLATGLLEWPASFLANLAYFYIVSCFIVFSFGRYRKKFNAKVVGFWAVVFVALRVFDSIIRPWLASQAEGQIAVSTAPQLSLYDTIGFFAIDVIVFAFYAFLVSAVYFIIREKIKK